MKKVTQKMNVIDAMRKNGKMATFSQLNQLTDISTWGTKTPFASIRGIVQTNKEFFKIVPGLWGLSEFRDEILANLSGKKDDKYSHSYFQGLVVEIGNLRKLTTFIPPQDKNRKFLDKKLGEIATTDKMFDFSYPEVVKFANRVDVVWFNDRGLPHSFYEIEHSTDFKNSLNKFYELQDFRAEFFIVADKKRKSEFDRTINLSIYQPLKKIVKFADYESTVKTYENEKGKLKIENGI